MPNRCLLLLAAIACASCSTPVADEDPPDPYPVAVNCSAPCVSEGRCQDTGYCSCETSWRHDESLGYVDSLTTCYVDGDAVYQFDGLGGDAGSFSPPWECCQSRSAEDCAGSWSCQQDGNCTPCLGFCDVDCE